MRRDPVAGVVWITFDKKFSKKETQVLGDSFWMDLPRFSEIKSFSDKIEIEYSPSNVRYWSFCSIAYVAFIIIASAIAVLFFAVPKKSVQTPVPQKPVPVPQQTVSGQRKPVSSPAPRKRINSSGSSQPVLIINTTPVVQPATQPSASVRKVSVPSSPAVTKAPQAPGTSGTAVPVSSAVQKSAAITRPAPVTLPQFSPQKAAPQSVPSAPAAAQFAEKKSIEERQINSSPIHIDLSPQNTVPPVRESAPPRRSKRKIQIMN